MKPKVLLRCAMKLRNFEKNICEIDFFNLDWYYSLNYYSEQNLGAKGKKIYVLPKSKVVVLMFILNQFKINFMSYSNNLFTKTSGIVPKAFSFFQQNRLFCPFRYHWFTKLDPKKSFSEPVLSQNQQREHREIHWEDENPNEGGKLSLETSDNFSSQHQSCSDHVC